MPTSRGWSLHTSLSPHTHTNTHTHTYTPTHTHTYTHTYKQRAFFNTFLFLRAAGGQVLEGSTTLHGHTGRDQIPLQGPVDAGVPQADRQSEDESPGMYICVRSAPFFLPGCGGLVRGEGKGAGRQAGMN